MEIAGKTAIVTGAAKRVGRAIAMALADRGADLVVHYNTSSGEAKRAVEEIRLRGARAIAVKANLADAKQAQGVVAAAIRQFKRVDILVNCASLYVRTPFGGIKESDWDRHLDVNLKAPFFLAQTAGKQMLKQKSGKIVNIIDSDTRQPYNHYLPYLVSKAGLDGLTWCLAKELAPHVQVNGVAPGPVALPPEWGPKIRKAILKQTPLGRIGEPEDIARAVLFCIEGTDFMTGAIIPVDGGQHIE